MRSFSVEIARKLPLLPSRVFNSEISSASGFEEILTYIPAYESLRITDRRSLANFKTTGKNVAEGISAARD